MGLGGFRGLCSEFGFGDIAAELVGDQASSFGLLSEKLWVEVWSWWSHLLSFFAAPRERYDYLVFSYFYNSFNALECTLYNCKNSREKLLTTGISYCTFVKSPHANGATARIKQ